MIEWYRNILRRRNSLKRKYAEIKFLAADIVEDLQYVDTKNKKSILAATMASRIDRLDEKVSAFSRSVVGIDTITFLLYGLSLGDMLEDANNRLEIVKARYESKLEVQEPERNVKVR